MIDALITAIDNSVEVRLADGEEPIILEATFSAMGVLLHRSHHGSIYVDFEGTRHLLVHSEKLRLDMIEPEFPGLSPDNYVPLDQAKAVAADMTVRVVTLVRHDVDWEGASHERPRVHQQPAAAYPSRRSGAVRHIAAHADARRWRHPDHGRVARVRGHAHDAHRT